jgi:hypothetical protein
MKPNSERTRVGKMLRQEEFIARVKAHGVPLDLTATVYKGSSAPVTVKCPEHGEVEAHPSVLLRGGGCRLCGHVKSGSARRHSLKQWAAKFKKVHGDTYEYLGLNSDEPPVKVVAVCAAHGTFTQSCHNHATGQGCPECGKAKITGRPGSGVEAWSSRIEEAHHGRYKLLELVGRTATLSCSKHGVFQQQVSDHADGHGCRSCSHSGTSIMQEELESFCRSLDPRISTNRKFAGRRELDILFSSGSLAVEFQGIYWHSEAVADRLNIARKHRLAEKHGIRVISIFEDDWTDRREAVEGTIRHQLGMQRRIHARKCEMVKVPSSEAAAFYDKHHLQGAPGDTGLTLGLKHDGELVMALSLTRVASIRGSSIEPGNLELRRMCSSACVVGGASKLFKEAVRETVATRIVSYSDIRAFSGGVYLTLGFVADGVTRPDYFYVRSGLRKRVRKANFTRSRMTGMEGFDPSLSEAANMLKMGWSRIYDCGKVRWLWAAGLHSQTAVVA